MLAHYHGQIINNSELGRSFGASDTTIRRDIDILEGTFMIRQLQPWFANIDKRQVKAPKIYFRDTGLLHSLLEIPAQSALSKNPNLSASWEGFALEGVIRARRLAPNECAFWDTHGGAELDLFIHAESKREAVEFRYTDRPATTKSMRAAMGSLKLEELTVIYPGERRFALGDKVEAAGLTQYVLPHTIMLLFDGVLPAPTGKHGLFGRDHVQTYCSAIGSKVAGVVEQIKPFDLLRA